MHQQILLKPRNYTRKMAALRDFWAIEREREREKRERFVSLTLAVDTRELQSPIAYAF